jgi:LAO/AO transport system kinase
MASRGTLGGLARATSDVVKALDAAGFDKILIETVGAGQAEVGIARAAHTVLVIEAPGLGDDVQAIKAGILEIADVLVVNKADQPNADATVRALRAALDLAHPMAHTWPDAHHHRPAAMAPAPESSAPLWAVPIVSTVAIHGQGVAELLEAIERHRAHLRASGELEQRERARLTHELETRLRDTLLAGLLAQVGNGSWEAAVARVLNREQDPATSARQLIEDSRFTIHDSKSQISNPKPKE